MDLYTGIRTTYVYLDADYNLTTGIQHDDAGSLYVNGALVASGGIQASSWKSVTLPLKRGWNRIDGLWNEGTGGDYFKFQAPLENDAHIIQLACRPNVNIDPMRAVTMQSVEEQKAGFNTFNKQFTAWSKETETTLKQQTDGLATLTKRVTDAELKLDPKQIWLGIKNDVTNTVDDGKTTLVNELKSKTGIDIQQGVITLDAEKVKVQNGKQTMAMFEGGKLRTELIDADKIFSKDITVTNNATITNLKAKNATVEGTVTATLMRSRFATIDLTKEYSKYGTGYTIDPLVLGSYIYVNNLDRDGLPMWFRLAATPGHVGIRLSFFLCDNYILKDSIVAIRSTFSLPAMPVAFDSWFTVPKNMWVEFIATPIRGTITWVLADTKFYSLLHGKPPAYVGGDPG